MPVTIANKEAIEIIETFKASRNGKDDKEGEYPETNLIQVLCIQYPITF